ncbi:cytochrome b/b6 domain-containing protein [Paraburkholderia bryophila]|uniref:cytochrome b/b6 domain-containing protein n=1 Tax=Paraburkholderia bryophila TaxID=420952 RepID=UPI00234B6644|nr:cytochrome b/b6 domain-containing protein [Paraburkholderia bryophila]WCM22234.1 cytochrome b/b6 domain-containing protein [Paraburkholderia bryophila]
MPNAPMTSTLAHPAYVRIFHWLNAASVIAMCMSGWQIYNASPIFPAIRFPAAITLGGWLGGALLWHFAIMWLLVANFLVYLGLSITTGRLRTKLLPVTVRAVASDLLAALRGKLAHDDPNQYNAVQKLAYLAVLADIALVVLSGLTVWKPVQFPLLRALMGSFDNARLVHFVAMSGLVGFLIVHVTMVALVPRSLLTIIRGR